MTTQQRIALIGLAGVLVSGFVFSNIYIHKRNRKELEDVARELAYTWKKKLNLTPEQTVLLEDSIIEFTLRKNEVLNSGIKQESVIRRLQAIQRNEHNRLKKFLDKEQFENYLQINKNITRKA